MGKEKVEPKSDFQKELEHLINKFSMENGSDTPDFILAEYLMGCLKNFNHITQRREKWYGRWDGWSWLTKNLPDQKAPDPKRKELTDFNNLRYCPQCGADWQGAKIPKKEQRKSTHYSRLIGIEVRGGYDGVSYWQCPDCNTTWNRFTGEISPEGVV